MPPDNYDYTQDKDFLAAPAAQQHQYLMQNEPEYAKSDPKTQAAYISHLNSGQDKNAQTLAQVPNAQDQAHQSVTIPTSGPSGSVETLPQKIAKLSPDQEQRRESGLSMEAPAALATGMGAGLFSEPVAAGVKLAKGAIGSYIGAKGGSYVGRDIPKLVGAGPEAQETGGKVGAFAGGLTGGIIGARSGLPKSVVGYDTPEWLRDPKAVAQETQEAQGDFMNKGYKPAQTYTPPALDKVPLEQAPIGPEINPPGPSNKVPMRMPAQRGLAPSGIGGATTGGPNTPFSDNLVLSPEEAAAQDRMQKIAEDLASKRGTQYASGLRPAGRNPSPNVWGPKRGLNVR